MSQDVDQEQELKCSWMMMAVPGTEELYWFGTDINLLLCDFPLLPENHILSICLLTEAIRKLVHWKRSPMLYFLSSSGGMNPVCTSFCFMELSLEMKGEETLFLRIWIFSLGIKDFGRQSLGCCLLSFISKVTCEVKLDLRLNACADICFSQNNS